MGVSLGTVEAESVEAAVEASAKQFGQDPRRLIAQPVVSCAAPSHALPRADFWEWSRSNVQRKRLIWLVGAPRFELGTPSPPDWCANRAALRSERVEL